MAIERRAYATWEGDLRSGSGTFDVGSGAISGQEVTFASRFTPESGGKTSPEELIAAAHATCVSMALANTLAGRGLHARPNRRGLPHHDHEAHGSRRGGRDRRGRVPGRRTAGEGGLSGLERARSRRDLA